MIDVYTGRAEIGNEVEVIDYNEEFFGLNPPSFSYKDWEIIREIDRAIQVEGLTVRTPYGLCSVFDISTGCKTVLNVINNPNIVFDITDCGNNALNVLFRNTKDRDIRVILRHASTDWEDVIPIRINGGKIVTDSFDLSCEISKYSY